MPRLFQSTAPRASTLLLTSERGCARAHHRRDRLPLPWFRRKKPEDLAPLTRAPERPEVEPLTVESPAESAHRRTIERHPPNKRRRGTRGGRNRKKSTAAAGGATVGP